MSGPLIWLRQVLIVLLGLGLAAAMGVLGIWQLEVYRTQGLAAAQRRAAEPAVALGTVAPAGEAVRDGFGRTVSFAGEYLPATQQLVPIAGEPGRTRVLTGLRQPDGSVVPVVRGVTEAGADVTPPRGPQSGTGVLLPSEEAVRGAKELESVRVPALAQRWPGPLVSGYVTLSAPDAETQGLAPAVARLPESGGRLRNGAYALQWWVFAAFAVGMAVKMARDIGIRDDLEVTLEEPAPS
jgi:cytochrome oxidase assembly protein ShyY1